MRQDEVMGIYKEDTLPLTYTMLKAVVCILAMLTGTIAYGGYGGYGGYGQIYGGQIQSAVDGSYGTNPSGSYGYYGSPRNADERYSRKR